MRAFISYSHKDQVYLERIQTALSHIKREGLLDSWTDNQINLGDKLDLRINNELLSSNLFIALVSPDYLASNYCYEAEFNKALKLEEEGKLKIIPIICRPCEWQRTPLQEFIAIPKDGKAISLWTNEDSAYFDISENVRKFLDHKVFITNSEPKLQGAINNKVPSTYKVKKDFDIVQKSDFLDETFKKAIEDIKIYLTEISGLENVSFKITVDTENQFKCFLVNRNMSIAQCELIIIKKEIGESQSFFREGDIVASFKKDSSDETLNFHLSNDDYNMFFSKAGQYTRVEEGETYDQKSITNEIWKHWLNQIGIPF